ncbi:MAG: efflux RND transporter periplasmic adaptor subunit [Firmicutes bacterium]|nr:efflux RND transporter periplasmic adaptor subunit [Bacillota bacterium]
MSNLENNLPKIGNEKKKNGKPLLIAIAVTTVCVLAGALFYFTYEKSSFIKTNNATVQYNMVTITSKMAGEILDIKVKQGDYICKGDVIMELDSANADSAQIDNSYIRSTIDGVVLRILGTPGQSILAGQTTAYIAHDSEMFIVSNIDEKEINKIKIGLNVDITIDQYGNQKFYGKVIEVGSATLSAFSIVPSASSGTFVKTTQYVPIKIQFIEQYDSLLAGANAIIRIHLK